MATPRHREVAVRRNVPCPLVILSAVDARFFGPAFGPRGHGIEESLHGVGLGSYGSCGRVERKVTSKWELAAPKKVRLGYPRTHAKGSEGPARSPYRAGNGQA